MSIISCGGCGQMIDSDWNAEDITWGETEGYCQECATDIGLLCNKCGEEVSAGQRAANGPPIKGLCTSCIFDKCGGPLVNETPEHDCHAGPESGCNCQKEDK